MSTNYSQNGWQQPAKEPRPTPPIEKSVYNLLYTMKDIGETLKKLTNLLEDSRRGPGRPGSDF